MTKPEELAELKMIQAELRRRLMRKGGNDPQLVVRYIVKAFNSLAHAIVELENLAELERS